jgi:hypothetical protein
LIVHKALKMRGMKLKVKRLKVKEEAESKREVK